MKQCYYVPHARPADTEAVEDCYKLLKALPEKDRTEHLTMKCLYCRDLCENVKKEVVYDDVRK